MPPDTLKYQKQDRRQLAPEREHATETTVAARVSHSTKAALKQLAEDRGTDISKLVGRLIRQELARAGDEEQAHDTSITDLNEWLRETREMMDAGARLTALRDHVQCADGLRLSIQASRTHYCRPRSNHGPYSAVEVGYPSERIEQLMPYAEDEDNPTETVYGWVPVDLLERIIDEHGGVLLDEAADPQEPPAADAV